MIAASFGLGSRRSAAIAAFAGVLGLALAGAARADPCADAVDAFLPGADGGFQSELLPGIALGVPLGTGAVSGSRDVVSLGNDGSITLAFVDNEIVDGPGDDFRVFENAFMPAGGTSFAEVATVWASADGVSFVPFPYELDGFVGLAGVNPVFSHPANGIDPRSPAAGGDAFDLADVGLSVARFIRLQDGGAALPDPGNAFPVVGFGKSGFDLDAVVASNSRERCSGCCDLNGDGAVTIDDVVGLVRIVNGAVAPTGCGQLPCDAGHCADTDADASIEIEDAARCLEKVVALPFECASAGLCDRS